MRKGNHVCQKFKEVERNLVVISYILKINALIHPEVRFSSTILQSQMEKDFRVFTHGLHFGG